MESVALQSEVLIVDDEADIRRITADFLEDEGYLCRSAADTVSALEMIEERRPHLVVLDIWLRGDDRADPGSQAADGRHPEIPFVMISVTETWRRRSRRFKLAPTTRGEAFKSEGWPHGQADDGRRAAPPENAELRERADADGTMTKLAVASARSAARSTGSRRPAAG